VTARSNTALGPVSGNSTKIFALLKNGFVERFILKHKRPVYFVLDGVQHLVKFLIATGTWLSLRLSNYYCRLWRLDPPDYGHGGDQARKEAAKC